MLRASVLRRASLVAPAAVCSSAASGAQLVNRILGATNPGATNAKAFGEIRDKVGSGKAAVYAHIGRALVFLNRGEDKLAAFDVDNANNAAGASGEAALLLASLKYQIAARNLAEEQRKATISGATSEMQIANAVGAAKKALDAVLALAGSDFAATLAAAEFHLHSEANASAALKRFDDAIEMISKNKAAPIVAAGRAEPWAVAAADVEESTADLPNTFKSKNIGADQLLADAESLASLRSAFGIGAELTDAQVTLLGSVLAVSARGGPLLDSVRTHSETFSPSHTQQAKSVVSRVAQLTHPLIEDHHHHVYKPAKAFHKDGVTVSSLVQSCPAGKHILDFVEEKCGREPSTELQAQDHDFFAALRRIEEATHAHAPNAPAAAATFYNTLFADLTDQALSRAKVGRAEALLALGKAGEAVAILDEVLRGQRYVDEWRVFLVKGRACKELGKVDESEAAFRQLHELKRQVGHNDIPLMDANRYKSAF